MRDELLGYLLGALDAEEHQRVEGYLAEQHDGHRDLKTLRAALAPLAADDGHLAPPTGLAQRTCRLIAARRGLSETWETGSSFGGGLSFRDYLIAASVVLLASTILLPAIARSRWQSQLLSCQDRLRIIGDGLTSYSDHNSHMFPFVPPDGPLALAGIVGPILSDNGYVQDRTAFFCPAAQHRRLVELPTLTALREAANDPRKLQQCLPMLGDYAYLLGYVDEGGRYRGAQNRQRSFFPVLSDCPPPNVAFASDLASPNHGRSGLNVLFEDGHVRWLTGSVADTFADHPFLNRQHRIAAGIGPDDAVLAAHDRSPAF